MRPQAGKSGMTTLFLIRLVGKLKLRARKVVEPIMAVLTLRSSPPWTEMPRAHKSPSASERSPAPWRGQAVFRISVWEGGSPVLAPSSFSTLPLTTFHKAGRQGPDPPETIHSLPLGEPHSFEGSGFREVKDGNQCHHSADEETGAAGPLRFAVRTEIKP